MHLSNIRKSITVRIHYDQGRTARDRLGVKFSSSSSSPFGPHVLSRTYSRRYDISAIKWTVKSGYHTRAIKDDRAALFILAAP